MIPLRDTNERRTFPVVTVALIAINVLFFIYELSIGSSLEGFLRSSAFSPAKYFQPGNVLPDAKSILLSMFLHGGWLHLLGNMLYLWIFGDNVEDELGHGRYLIFYLVCGWAATLSHAYLNRDSNVPSIGASGAIAGVLGAYLIMFPKARVLTLIPLGFYMRTAELPALLVLGLWFVLQAFTGALSLGARSAQSTGVAVWAHVGGFVAGMILGPLLRKRGGQPQSRAWSAFGPR